mmetsp:Transcript_5133/g.8018  ORF Transcript_5133/g.8018 Transcript_5133/m.8018 type:complete len:85 (-) Transcript_5133:863-1117(-)
MAKSSSTLSCTLLIAFMLEGYTTLIRCCYLAATPTLSLIHHLISHRPTNIILSQLHRSKNNIEREWCTEILCELKEEPKEGKDI